jgi:hypothetical protein
VSGAIGLVAVPPVLLETGYGIWKENRLDQEVWQVIDKAVSATKLELEYKTVRPEPGLPGNSSGAAPRCRCWPRRMRWVHLEMRATASRAGTYGRGRRLLPRRTAASAVGGMGYQRPVPGHLSPFGWDHLAVGARCLVGGFRRPHGPGTVLSPARGCRRVNRCGLRFNFVRPGEDCRRLNSA